MHAILMSPAMPNLRRSTKYSEEAAPHATAEFLSLLEGLSDQQRSIVALRCIGEFTPSEIAEVLHTSPGSVRVQLHRAHAHLRNDMENLDDQ